jgi:peptidoglycan-N-acetylglucosamine deacetylase
MKLKNILYIATFLFVGIYTFYQISKSRSFQFFGEIYDHKTTNQPIIALTFDDGPTKKTPDILAILKKHKIKATFFINGIDIEKYPIETRKIIAEGHEVGNHTYSHKRMIFKTLGFIKKEIESTDSLIYARGYKHEILFRPPYGKKLLLLPYYLSKNKRKTIMWDVEPESIKAIKSDSRKIANYTIENTKNGSIILLHVMKDPKNISLNAVESIIVGLKKKGFVFLGVSEMLEN